VRLATRWRHYRKARGQGAPQPPVEAGFGVRITFREVVRGPICLGYGGHFGLGGFGA
jgi:CRISPR-associated protein Csb2